MTMKRMAFYMAATNFIILAVATIYILATV